MQLCRGIDMVGEASLAVLCSLGVLIAGMFFYEGCMELGELARHLNRRRTWLIPKDGAICNLGPPRGPFHQNRAVFSSSFVGSDTRCVHLISKRDT